MPFNIIAISETWINPEKEIDFELDGYEFVHTDRKNKAGGGVAIFVDKRLKFKALEKMSVVVDNILECITVEVNTGKSKNVIVSCIYRTPGSNIEFFKDWMEDVFKNKSQDSFCMWGFQY